MEFNDLIASEQLPLLVLALSGAVVILSTIFTVWIYLLQRRIRTLLGNTNAKDLEETLRDVHTHISKIQKDIRRNEKHLSSLEERVSRSVQGVETIRYNPFKGNGGGGNQSFSTSFIDERGNGVVISSLYSRERMSVYAKAVRDLSSDHTLTEEEKQVLNKASEKIKNTEK